MKRASGGCILKREAVAGIVAVKAFIDHHLLAVMRPALGVGRGAKNFAHV